MIKSVTVALNAFSSFSEKYCNQSRGFPASENSWNSEENLVWLFLLSGYYNNLWYTLKNSTKCTLWVCSPKSLRPLLLPFFNKSTNVRQHYFQISNTKSHTNRWIIRGNRGNNVTMMDFTESSFTKTPYKFIWSFTKLRRRIKTHS